MCSWPLSAYTYTYTDPKRLGTCTAVWVGGQSQTSWSRSTLQWSSHVTVTVQKASRRIGLLCFMARNLTLFDATVSDLFDSFARLCLEYASPVWCCGLSAADAMTLYCRAAASSYGSKNSQRCMGHTSKIELFTAVDWPSLRWRRAELYGPDPPTPQERDIAFLDFIPFRTLLESSNGHHRKPEQVRLLPRIHS